MPKGIPRQGHVAIAAPEGDERRPIIRAEAHMLQGQTESRSRILHCPADLIAPAIAMMPVFHELSRAGGPSQQSRKTTAHIGESPEASGVFHEVSRAEGPSQQGRKTTAGSGLRLSLIHI